MNKFIRTAIKEAQKGMRQGEGGPFGAVIVKDGKVVAKGHNVVIKTNDPTCHAEVTVIRKAAKKLKRFDLSDCEIYTTCEPCPMCLGAILWSRIGKVYYGCDKNDARKIGFDDEAFYKAFKDPFKTPLIRWERIEPDGCRKVFDEWDAKADKTKY